MEPAKIDAISVDVITDERAVLLDSSVKGKWSIKLTNVSDIDVSGNMDIAYDVLLDGVVIYPNIRSTGDSKSIVDQAKLYAQELKTNRIEGLKFKVGDEFDI
jgi:hypothetical protein